MTVTFNFTGRSLLLASFLILPVTYLHAHSGSPLGVAWSTCDGKPKSQACEYKGFHGESYIGTCQVMANNMLCVRNQPIQYPEGVAKEAHTERTKAGEAADVANQNVKEHVIKKGVSKQAEAVTPQGLSEPVEAAAAGSAPTNKQ